MANTSFNPFKMRGSYVGAGIAIVIWIISISISHFRESLPNAITNISDFIIIILLVLYTLLTNWFLKCTVKNGFWFKIKCSLTSANIGISIMFGLFGFLIGWGIHSIFRALRR